MFESKHAGARLKIVDFGLARHLPGGQPSAGGELGFGTPGFVAPEVLFCGVHCGHCVPCLYGLHTEPGSRQTAAGSVPAACLELALNSP